MNAHKRPQFLTASYCCLLYFSLAKALYVMHVLLRAKARIRNLVSKMKKLKNIYLNLQQARLQIYQDLS